YISFTCIVLPDLHSFPTRRSSDLALLIAGASEEATVEGRLTGRGLPVMLPARVDRHGIRRVEMPSLSPRERTRLETALGAASRGRGRAVSRRLCPRPRGQVLPGLQLSRHQLQLASRLFNSGDVLARGAEAVLQTPVMDQCERFLERAPAELRVLLRRQPHGIRVHFGGVDGNELHAVEAPVVDGVDVL